MAFSKMCSMKQQFHSHTEGKRAPWSDKLGKDKVGLFLSFWDSSAIRPFDMVAVVSEALLIFILFPYCSDWIIFTELFSSSLTLSSFISILLLNLSDEF